MPDISDQASSKPHHRYSKPRTVRRNVRSCNECKKRKVRCSLSSEKDPEVKVCGGCGQRGIPCVIAGNGRNEKNGVESRKINVDERLGRVEGLLERLIEEKSASVHSNQTGREDDSREEDLSGTEDETEEVHQNGPILSLFDHPVLGRRDLTNTPPSTTQSNLTIRSKTPSTKFDKVRQKLAALLPSQGDANLIAQSTNGWVLIQVLCTSATDLYTSSDPISSFNLAAVSKRHPVIIARTLLYIAICMQQLPTSFDASRLQMYKSPSTIDHVISQYVDTVASLVTTDDELVASMEGLECLILLGVFHNNAGSLRRSWLTSRRAIAVAQLLDLQREYLRPLKEETLMEQMKKRGMWHKVVQTDRYLGILLGLPCGTGRDCFGDVEEDLGGVMRDSHGVFERRLCLVAGEIGSRNLRDDVKSYETTRRIDGEMEKLGSQMSSEWWAIPSLRGVERSSGVAGQFDRVLAQAWFFQLRSLLHLPFLLWSDFDEKFEKSSASCLAASREVIYRFLRLKEVGHTHIMCKVIDFGAFIATVILILDQLQQRSADKYFTPMRDADRDLINKMIVVMEEVAYKERSSMARQSLEVMRALFTMNNEPTKMRLKIPYFGTITLVNGHVEQPSLASDSTPSSSTLDHVPHAQSDRIEDWQAPLLWFQSSQFAFEGADQMMEDWNAEDFEEVVFDSMMDVDIGPGLIL